jgi:magnesium transporter
MTEIRKESHCTENMQAHLQQIQRLLESITLTNDASPSQVASPSVYHDNLDKLRHTPHISELQKKLDELHPSDLAYVLEALPLEQRKLVWSCVRTDYEGKVLIEVSDAVRETLIAAMSGKELRDAAEHLDTGEIAGLAANLPQSVMRDVFKSLSIEEREQLRAAISYPQDSVGALMDFNMVTIRKDATVESVLRFLRRLDELPDHTDQLFVVDREDIFNGVLPLNKLLINEPEVKISTLMNRDGFTLHPDDNAHQAAQAFERYALVSSPVIDEDGKLLGRVPVNAVVDFIRSKSEHDMLNLAGLHEEEDIFASVLKSAKNRWLWLSLNLCTAFFASRVIGEFEDSITEFVALAALMPIVVSIAGSAGNQTIAIVIRSLALGQINEGNAQRLLRKELAISILNGMVWGGISGAFAYLLYKSPALSLVMASAILLNLMLGALVGMLIPLTLKKLGRNPAFGSSVLLMAITTSGGFFIFLGLATLFLIN